ncbi:MAG TPA: HAMP domain-containing sensor histidine kinase, partial [Blastocatellia bacterium]|nr:HAMP domain-containing sensor histidine kinase [Blastocatellia bacterium]
MTTPNNDPREERVLVFMPTGRDALLVCGALKERGITAHACSDINELSQWIESEAGAVLVAEEALKEGPFVQLMDALNHQPVWSDLPVILFSTGDRNVELLLEGLGTRLNATIVERPIRRTILVSAVQGALRARRRQYQARDLLTQLKDADRQKDLFLATLSHELRTPLNSMLGWIQLLQDGRLPTTEYAHALEVLERNAKSQAELVSDILFLSRVVTGKLTLDNRLLDLNLVIESAIDTVRPSIEEKGLRLEISVDSATGPILGDPDRLQQVVCNLLSNAVKFTPDGGRIDVSLERKGAFAEITVKDTGQGISPEFLPYVFDRFRQADSSSTRNFGGLGLGLAIVRHLVELHGGTVRTESEGLG